MSLVGQLITSHLSTNHGLLISDGGGPRDGGPLIINPIYTLYSGYLLCIHSLG